MYSLSAYGRMITDRRRLRAYAAALRGAVRPGSVVVDVGSGTGIFALLACRLGARKVYAVEPDGAVHVARETAAANGFADRIEFIHDDATRVTLPERADVVVSDLRGVLPPFGRHLEVVMDVRRRFLAPGGALIPLRDTLWAAPVSARKAYDLHVVPRDADAFDFDMGAARRAAANEWHRARFAPARLVAPPRAWGAIDYTSVEDPRVFGAAEWVVERPEEGHGLAVWFDAELAPGIGFSNAPGRPPLIYGSGYFPWPDPLPLGKGDRIAVEIRADPVGESYHWTWTTRLERASRDGPLAFTQSTAIADPPDVALLRRGADGFRPTLGDEGHTDAEILARMDGSRTLAEIAAEIAGTHPDRFADGAAALAHVRRLSRHYAC